MQIADSKWQLGELANSNWQKAIGRNWQIAIGKWHIQKANSLSKIYSRMRGG
jgi:hypothetical protein